ncbi:MAG: ABC transporter substrate-binding protein [Candidatus Limivivens sp.]|nr:ABC transporter substrate-binding protein [Candidatus Limivivens sp.]
MKRKTLAAMLAAAMTASLCAGGMTVSAEGDVKTVVLSFFTWTGAPQDTQMVQDAMNEITREKLGIEVELQISDFASYQQNMTLALSGGEQIDIMANLSTTFANFAQQGYFMDLEEDDLLTTYGQGIIDAVGQDNVDACRIGGVLYGLPNNRDLAQGRGCAAIARQYLDGIGYEVDDSVEIMKISLDELNDIYAQLHEAYPDKEVYRPTTTSMQQFSNVDLLGGNAFGVLLNNGESLTVENLFTSDFYKEYCQRIYDYNQKGYISQDAATDTTAVGELVKAGTLMSYTTGGKPGIKVQETGLSGQEMVIFQTMENYIGSTSVAQFPWTVPINSDDPAAAVTYLNELYTNPDLQNLLAWGIEGTHYVLNDEGLATYPEGVDASNSGYNHSMGWLMPNQFLTHVWEGNNPDLWEEMKEFNNSAIVSSASGFAFNSENVLNEMTAVQNIYNEFQTSVEYGFVDPETGIQEMNDKMMAAGLQNIIDEKQAQLDEWAAANGK